MPYPFAYTWSCATEAGEACVLPADQTPAEYFQSSPKVVFPAGALSAATYVFSVRVTRQPAAVGRTVTTAMTVTLRAPPAGVTDTAATTLRASGNPTAGRCRLTPLRPRLVSAIEAKLR